ncbi:MAG: hypothetical protein DMG25_18770 [Acidobacteria bacterium]|nr:MAG: hypothetical protein DMG25_18770 [Acidobacteriota bacterium]
MLPRPRSFDSPSAPAARPRHPHQIACAGCAVARASPANRTRGSRAAAEARPADAPAADGGRPRLARRRYRSRRLPVTVDSRYDVLSYTGVTAATPNEPEIEAAFGQPIGDNLELLDRLGMKMLRRQSLQALVITRGREGMVVFEPHQKPRRLPIFGSDQVADVTGAGDTVVAAFTLALAAGASFVHAAMLANCAGGLVVMKSGTATVARRELEEALRNA